MSSVVSTIGSVVGKAGSFLGSTTGQAVFKGVQAASTIVGSVGKATSDVAAGNAAARAGQAKLEAAKEQKNIADQTANLYEKQAADIERVAQEEANLRVKESNILVREANEVFASAIRAAINERRQYGFASSRAQALAAASGAGGDSQSVINIMMGLEAEGDNAVQMAMWEGRDAAQALIQEAVILRDTARIRQETSIGEAGAQRIAANISRRQGNLAIIEGQIAVDQGDLAQKTGRTSAFTTVLEGATDVFDLLGRKRRSGIDPKEVNLPRASRSL